MKEKGMTPLELDTFTPPVPGDPSRRISIKQIDAFTNTPLTGNPAGVILDGRDLSDPQMQAIAAEIAVSETAFILPPNIPDADLRIRWFTPKTEVPLCGHATIAAFHALAEEGLYGMTEPGSFTFRVETQSGILPVTVHKMSDTVDVFFGLPVPEFVRAGQYKLDVMRILNISLEEFENRLPIVVSNHLYVPIRRLHTIFSMKPNHYAMAQFLTNRNLSGLSVFTMETIDETSTAHARFFAPTLGINEDPVTGSASGPIGAYLFEQGRIDVGGDTISIVVEQGDVIGRKGRVRVRLGVRGDQITSVEVGGRAVTILDGFMLVA